jgi:hypothetical protein
MSGSPLLIDEFSFGLAQNHPAVLEMVSIETIQFTTLQLTFLSDLYSNPVLQSSRSNFPSAAELEPESCKPTIVD